MKRFFWIRILMICLSSARTNPSKEMYEAFSILFFSCSYSGQKYKLSVNQFKVLFTALQFILVYSDVAPFFMEAIQTSALLEQYLTYNIPLVFEVNL